MPDCLATNMAALARWSSSTVVVPCSGKRAIPTLAETRTTSPLTTNSGLHASRIFHATATAVARVDCVGGEDRELVTAQPGDHVCLAKHSRQPLGDLLEQRVAVLVAE